SKGILFALLITSATFAQNDKSTAPPSYASHTDLSYYVAPGGSQVPIKTVSDWSKRREQILAGMQEVMGPLPHLKSPVPLDVQTIEEHKEDKYIRRKITYHTDDPKQLTHAWILIPLWKEGRTESFLPVEEKFAAVLCLHQTGPNGKD